MRCQSGDAFHRLEDVDVWVVFSAEVGITAVCSHHILLHNRLNCSLKVLNNLLIHCFSKKHIYVYYIAAL